MLFARSKDLYVVMMQKESLGVVRNVPTEALCLRVRENYPPYYIELLAENLHNLNGSRSHRSTGAEDSRSTILVQLLVVLGGDNTTHNNYDILPTELLELCDNLGNKCEVARSE